MKKIISLIKRSLYMDAKYVSLRGKLSEKLDFIFKKYFLLIKHFFIPFKIEDSKIKVFGNYYYYESNLGLVEYHVSLIHHENLIRGLSIDSEKAVLLDIGANVGCFSMVFKDIFPDSLVFSFEPAPAVFNCLKHNMSRFEHSKVENIGMSDHPGDFKFEYNPINTEMGKISESGNILVKIDTLDRYVDRNKISHIDLLKIDTETFEMSVLEGGKNSLKKVKYLLLEITFDDNNNMYTVPELMSKLVSEEYSFQLLKIVNFLDKDISDSKVMDFLFVNQRYEKDQS